MKRILLNQKLPYSFHLHTKDASTNKVSVGYVVVALIFMLFSGTGWGQVATSYTFSESTGTYTPITGGTQLVTTTGGVTSHDATVDGISLGSSSFNFNGSTITAVTMLSDGALVLGTSSASTSTVAISSSMTANGIIAALNMDLRSTSLSGQVYERRWEDVGTEVVFQWQNAARWSSDTTERFSFQIRINKSTGVINIVYGNMTTIANSTTYQPQVGLRGATNADYNIRRLTTTVPDSTPNWGAPNGTAAGSNSSHTCRFTSASSCFPTSGLIFTWTPASPCLTPTAKATAYTAGTVSLNSVAGSFTAASPAPSGYLIVRSPTTLSANPVDGTTYSAGGTLGNGTIVQASNATSFTASSLTSNSSYTFNIFSYNNTACSGGPKYYTSSLVGTAITCPAAPTAPTVTSLTSNGVTLSWTASAVGGGASTINYVLEVYTDSGYTTHISGSPFSMGTAVTQNITGLTANTIYYYRIKANNSSCDSTYLTGNFTTPCNVINSFPYAQGFNTASVMPSCFSATEGSTGATYHWESVTSDSSHGAGSSAEGAAFMRMNYFNASATYNPYYLNFPSFDLGATPKRATFSIWMGSSSGTNSLVLQVSSNGGGAWTDLATYTANASNTSSTASWESKIVDLTSYASQTVTFRLKATSNYGSSYCNVGFDNFVIENIPSCLTPSSVSATSSITDTSATINWTASSSTPSGGYDWEVRTSGSGGSGATGLAAAGSVAAGVLTANVTGLLAATSYTVYVRANCGGGDMSSWVSGGAFVSACAIPNAPSNVVTSNITSSTLTVGFTAASPAPTGYMVFLSTTSTVIPTLTNGTTYTSGTIYNIGGIDYKCVISNQTATSHNLTGGISNTQHNYFVFSRNSMNNCSGYPYYSAGITGYAITCPAAPTAPVVSALTTTSATLSWTASAVGGGASTINYILEVYTDSGYTTHITGSPFTMGTAVTQNITGLTAATTYYYRIKANNGSCDSTYLSGNFTTVCNAITTLPWTEGFETPTIPSFPSCWLKENGDWATTNNANSTSDADARTGAQFLRETYSATNEYIWTPGFTLTAGASYDFSFYWAGDTYSGWTGDVFVNSSQLSTGATQLGTSFVTSSTTTTKTYAQVKQSFVPSTTGVYYFAIRVNASSVPYYLSFDDFKLEVTPIPIVVTPSTSTLCAGESVTLTASSSASYTYSWSPSTGLNTTSGATVTATPSSTTTYTVTGIDTITSAITSKSVTVTVNAFPSDLNVTNTDADICSGSVQTITATGGVLSNVVIFSEDFNGATNSWTTNNAGNGGGYPSDANWTLTPDGYDYYDYYNYDDYIFHSNDNTQFYLSNSFAQDGSATTANITRLVSPVFSTVGFTNATLTFYSNFLAYNNDHAYIDVSTDGGSTWTNAVADYTSTIGSSTYDSSTYAYMQSFSLVTLNLNAYVGYANVKIRFRYSHTYDYWWAIDNVKIVGDYQQITWSPITELYTNVACTPAYAYTTGSHATTVYAKPTANVTYTATATNGSCSKTDTVSYTIKPNVSITTQPVSQTVCAGSSVTFSVVAANSAGGYLYEWRKNGTPIPTATNSSYTIASTTVADAANYTVYIVGDCGDVTSNVATLTVNPSPTATIASTNGPETYTNEATFTITGTTDAVVTYTINGGANATTTLTAGTSTLTVDVTNTTTSQILTLVSVTNGTCTATLSNTATVAVGPIRWTGTTSNSWSTGTNWTTGTVPTGSRNIEIPSGTPILDTNFTLPVGKQLSITGTGSLTMSPSSVLTLAGTADFGGKSVTLQSDATGTATIAEITGTLNGATNVTVERYIPAKRAWRALTAPLKGSNGSLYATWQNNGSTVSGTGVSIWGPSGTNIETGPNYSVLNYTATGWVGVNNTSTSTLFDSTKNNAYLVFVTGPYGSNNIATSTGATATTLKATGQLITGTVNYSNIIDSKHTLIGNPYASALTPSTLLDGGTNLITNFWVWDPNVGTTGGYNMYDDVLNKYTSLTGSYPTNTTAIQSGQAFFVRATTGTTGSFSLIESKKSTAVSNVFGRTQNTSTPATVDASIFRVGMYKETTDGWKGADGAIVGIYATASNDVNDSDGKKMANGSENIAFVRNNTTLSSEHHAPIQAQDELYMRVWNTSVANYKLKINTENFADTTLEATLIDLFTGTQTPLMLDGSVVEYPFAVTSNTASTGDRFKVVFQNSALGVHTSTSASLKLYPNPATSGMVQVQLPEGDYSQCSYEVVNGLGQIVAQSKVPTDSSHLFSINTASFASSWYVVRIVENGKTIYQTKLIVKN